MCTVNCGWYKFSFSPGTRTVEADATGGHRMTLLPRDQVEGLARLWAFAEWRVTGDFTDEPLADGHCTRA